MRPHRRHQLLALLPLLLLANPRAHAQERPRFTTSTEATMSADQTARLIGALHYLERLQQRQPAIVNPMESLTSRQEILLRVTSVSLQLDATMGEIDAEIADTRELQN